MSFFLRLITFFLYSLFQSLKNAFLRPAWVSIGLTLLSSLIVLTCIKLTPTIHLPYLVTPALAAGLGFLEPRKGWVLAVLQAALIWMGYTLFFPNPNDAHDRDIEQFGLYGSIILTFVGSFIGGLLQRTLHRGRA